MNFLFYFSISFAETAKIYLLSNSSPLLGFTFQEILLKDNMNEIKLAMDWILFSIIVISSFAAMINIIGLYLLLKLRNPNINENQKVLFVSLCFAELLNGVITITRCFTLIFEVRKVLRDFIVCFHQTTLASMYVVSMFLVTIDRYLLVNLNIKYSVYCTPKKLKRILRFSWIVFITLHLGCFSTLLFCTYDIEKYTNVYLYPVYEIAFLGTVFITYSSIFKKFNKSKLESKRIREQISQNSNLPQDQRFLKARFNIYLPTLIILSFVTFTIVPNILFTIRRFSYISSSALAYCKILYPLGWCCDSLIYCCSFIRNGRKTMS